MNEQTTLDDARWSPEEQVVVDAIKRGEPPPPDPQLRYWLTDCFVCGALSARRHGTPRPESCWGCGRAVCAVEVQAVGTDEEVEALRRQLWGWPLSDDDRVALERIDQRLGAPTQRPSDRDELSDPGERELGPFARGSETSRKAALESYPRQGSQRWRVLDVMWRYTHSIARRQTLWTRDELAVAARLSPNTLRPRVRELIEGGWVRVVDEEGRSGTGRAAERLALTEKAREELAARGASAAEAR